MRSAAVALCAALLLCAAPLACADEGWEGLLEGETSSGWMPLARLRSDGTPPTHLSTSAAFTRLRLDGRIEFALPAACPAGNLPADLELWVSEGHLRGAAASGACVPRTALRVRQRVVGEPARPAKADVAAAQQAAQAPPAKPWYTSWWVYVIPLVLIVLSSVAAADPQAAAGGGGGGGGGR